MVKDRDIAGLLAMMVGSLNTKIIASKTIPRNQILRNDQCMHSLSDLVHRILLLLLWSNSLKCRPGILSVLKQLLVIRRLLLLLCSVLVLAIDGGSLS